MSMIAMVICHFDETNSLGGLERQAGLLAKTLVDQGEQVVILGSTRAFKNARWTERSGVPVRLFWTYTSPQLSGRHLPAALIWAVQLLFWLVWHRKKVRVVHCHQLRIHAFVSSLARRWIGIPNVSKSATGGDGADIRAIGTRKYFGSWGRSFVIRNTDAFVATTDSIANDLIRFGVPSDKIRTIPNGLEIPDNIPSGPNDRFRKCIFVGRFEDDKNVVPLAKAASDRLTDTNVSLDFYGGGSLEPEIKVVIQDGHQVNLKGQVDRIEPLLNGYGWLILPSKAEGLSNAMLEAMTYGVVPVVTSVSGSVDHIVEGENGLFLQAGDSSGIAAGLDRIVGTTEEGWKSLSRSAMNYAQSRFDINAVSLKYKKLYRDLEDQTSGLVAAKVYPTPGEP